VDLGGENRLPAFDEMKGNPLVISLLFILVAVKMQVLLSDIYTKNGRSLLE